MIIAILIVAILGGTFWLVIAYNKTVDITHDIVSLKTQLDAVGANSTALNNNIVSILGTTQFQTLAIQDGLVAEKNPQYYQTDQNGISLLNNR